MSLSQHMQLLSLQFLAEQCLQRAPACDVHSTYVLIACSPAAPQLEHVLVQIGQHGDTLASTAWHVRS